MSQKSTIVETSSVEMAANVWTFSSTSVVFVNMDSADNSANEWPKTCASTLESTSGASKTITVRKSVFVRKTESCVLNVFKT